MPAPDRNTDLRRRIVVLAQKHRRYGAELIRRRGPWKTRETLELATLEWAAWFNHVRLLEPIGYIPPAEAEANYYRQLAKQPSPEQAELTACT